MEHTQLPCLVSLQSGEGGSPAGRVSPLGVSRASSRKAGDDVGARSMDPSPHWGLEVGDKQLEWTVAELRRHLIWRILWNEWKLYEFPSAAVTNQGKLSLKQAKSIVLPFWRSEANKSERAKIKGSARLTPSADSVEESVHLFLQLVKAASIAWLVATSLQSLLPSAHGLLPSRMPSPSPFLIKSLCWLYWAHPDSPGQSPHLKILNWVTKAKSLLSWKVTYSQVSRIYRIFLGRQAVIQPTTEGKREASRKGRMNSRTHSPPSCPRMKLKPCTGHCSCWTPLLAWLISSSVPVLSPKDKILRWNIQLVEPESDTPCQLLEEGVLLLKLWWQETGLCLPPGLTLEDYLLRLAKSMLGCWGPWCGHATTCTLQEWTSHQEHHPGGRRAWAGGLRGV